MVIMLEFVRSKALFFVCLLLGICAAQLSYVHHRAVDEFRFVGQKLEERYYLPSPQATKALSLGHQTMVSDFAFQTASTEKRHGTVGEQHCHNFPNSVFY